MRAYAAALAWLLSVPLACGVVGALITGLSPSHAHDIAAPVGGALVGLGLGALVAIAACVRWVRGRRFDVLGFGAAVAVMVALFAAGGVAWAVQAEWIRW